MLNHFHGPLNWGRNMHVASLENFLSSQQQLTKWRAQFQAFDKCLKFHNKPTKILF